ncbi:MAG: hypothetical protein KDC32_15705 [Saprospiraceae bacterium]|nr:hypothetical protein [Saprospiraceae bacterium]
MALLIPSRTAQFPLVAEFNFNFDDTMLNDEGVVVDFGASDLTERTVVVIPLPPGATVIGGAFTRHVAFDTAGYDVTVGDTTDEDRYLASADLKALGSTPLVPTGYVGVGENIVLNITTDDVCTTGSATLRVEYVVANRSNEVQIA